MKNPSQFKNRSGSKSLTTKPDYLDTIWTTREVDYWYFGNHHIGPWHDLISVHRNAIRWLRSGAALEPMYVIAVWPTSIIVLGSMIWAAVVGGGPMGDVGRTGAVLFPYSFPIFATAGFATFYRVNHLIKSWKYGVSKVLEDTVVFDEPHRAYEAPFWSKVLGWVIVFAGIFGTGLACRFIDQQFGL